MAQKKTIEVFRVLCYLLYPQTTAHRRCSGNPLCQLWLSARYICSTNRKYMLWKVRLLIRCLRALYFVVLCAMHVRAQVSHGPPFLSYVFYALYCPSSSFPHY
ncbi:unnamed protein product, partial [Ectocarpus fasciculatus]